MTSQDQKTDRRTWSGVGTHAGVFCIGMCTLFASQSVIGKMNVSGAPQHRSMSSFAPAQPRDTIRGVVDPRSGTISMSSPDRSRTIEIDRAEYCRQVALSVLVRFNHEIREDQIVFTRDPRTSGNAIQQFCDAFGHAIDTGMGIQTTSIPAGDSHEGADLIAINPPENDRATAQGKD